MHRHYQHYFHWHMLKDPSQSSELANVIFICSQRALLVNLSTILEAVHVILAELITYLSLRLCDQTIFRQRH